jgi:rod shape-determining protein MreC
MIVSLLVAALLAVASGVTGENIPGKMVQTVLKPLRSGANTVVNQAESLYDYIFRYEALEAENAALKEELAALREDARDVASLQREIERLRKLAQLKTIHEDYQLVDGYIIARTAQNWVNTLTINRGSDVGIQVGMCAITETGQVVGLVTEVGSNYAVITTVLDPSLEISATISNTGYSGMVSGGYDSGYDNLLRMDYLSSDSVIKNHDPVVTAGSTVYPRNLLLGYVVDAGFEDNGLAKFAILQPAADIENLEQIFIITDYKAE